LKTLRHLLEEEHSKRQKDLITQKILSGNFSIQEIVEIVKSNDGIYAQRGAYVLTGLHDDNPNHLTPFIEDLWQAIQTKSHQAIPRAIYRLFSDIDLPEEIEGEIFEVGSKTFMSKKTAVAIKAHIMKILTNIASKYPELKDEVIFMIKEQLPGSSAGYRTTAKRELKRLGVKT